MKNHTILILLIFNLTHCLAQTDAAFIGETVTFKSNDGITITADLYIEHGNDAPFIILYHQAGYSRGEYREIAPKLNALGFNCMAVDQRSGDQVNQVINQTHKDAQAANKPTEYLDALPDIEAAYLYVKYSIKPKKIILWGSSYSAALMFYMGSEHHNNLSGILSFAPGEYFKVNGKDLKTYAAKITCPVFVTSAKSEYANWKPIYGNIKSDKSSFLPESEGKHGSKALWKNNANHMAYWSAVETFLLKIK